MSRVCTIAPRLWFDSQAEKAANFYVSNVPSSKITDTGRYGETGREFHGSPADSERTVAFEQAGRLFSAFRFNEAISAQVLCEMQEEIDRCLAYAG